MGWVGPRCEAGKDETEGTKVGLLSQKARVVTRSTRIQDLGIRGMESSRPKLEGEIHAPFISHVW